MTAGIVGFNTDMGATKSSEQGDDASSGVIATVRTGMKEVEMRFVQPFRHNLGKYLLPVLPSTPAQLPAAVHSII